MKKDLNIFRINNNFCRYCIIEIRLWKNIEKSLATFSCNKEIS